MTTCPCIENFTATGHGTELELRTTVVDPDCPAHGKEET